MTDNNWWKEKLSEHYYEHEEEIKAREESEVKELILCADGIYRPQE
ncbi:hypothetical protein [Lederbergia lenta]|nr:hypothetical protein [Lederbergia lenta]MCM3109978.1 hypothetical protein [Lederbergia lenta]